MRSDLNEMAHRRSGDVDVDVVIAERERNRREVEEALERPSGLITESLAALSGFDTGAPPIRETDTM